jgi:integrase
MKRKSSWQSGSIFRYKLKGRYTGPWYGRWYEDDMQDGKIIRKQVCRKLCDYSDRFHNKTEVRPLLEEILRPINERRTDARSTMSIEQFVTEVYLPWAKQAMKPSTYHGYEKLWRKHLNPRVGSYLLRDFRTSLATNMLNDVARAGLGKRSVQHVRALGSMIFSHAVGLGIVESNPFAGARLLVALPELKPTHATSPTDVMRMLHALHGHTKAKAAIGLCYFAGLRPGEARGLEWTDYDGDILTVRRSVWRKHTTAPKTEQASAPLPVIQPLRELLDELHLVQGNPTTGPILRGENGRPLNLDMLSRVVIRPVLEANGIRWDGFYALRRGAATSLTAESGSLLGAKGMLRHSSALTTATHYVKSVDEATLRAAKQFEASWQRELSSNSAVDGNTHHLQVQ